MLKDNIYELINNNAFRLRLALELGVSENTIRNYINNKSDQLTLAASLKIIREETGLSDEQILAKPQNATIKIEA
jgi:predicted transcriptional regulator